MGALWIAWRELRASLQTTMGWLVLSGWLGLTGLFWYTMMMFYVEESTSLVANPYASQQMNLSDHLLVPFFDNCKVILVMMLPALSMRLFSEDLKQRTMELLLTAPISTAEIVFGKFFGALGFVGVMLLFTAHYPAMLYYWGAPETGVVVGGYLSLLLFSAAMIAMGMMYSAMTSNQLVAAALSFATGLVFFILWWVDDNPDSIFFKLALSSHLQDLTSGEVRLSDMVYLLGFTGVFLLATHQRIESLRWR